MYQRKKILFFLSPSVGGAQRVSVLFSKILDPSLYEVIYVIVGESKSSIINLLPSDAVVRKIKIRNIYDFSTMKILLLMKREQPYAVFCSQMYLNNRVIFAAKLLGGIKVVIRNNSMVQNLRSQALNYSVAKRLYCWADRVVAQTPEMRDEIISVFNVEAHKTKVIYNPLEKQQIESMCKFPSPYSSDDEIRFVCVGRVVAVKGYEVAIKAMEEISKLINNVHLYIVGDYECSSSYFEQLNNLIKELCLGDRVHFVGYTDNPYVWVKNADVFLLSSYIEGLPNALIEALYMQKPVVATKCVPVVERIVQNGLNGYLVDCGDHNGMAKNMKNALELTSIPSFNIREQDVAINNLFEF